MDKRKLGVIAAVGVLALGVIGGFAVRAGAETPASDATPPVTQATADDQNAAADATEATEPGAGKLDTDNVQEEVQQGDQNGADDATEAADEAKAEADGPGGHADDPADANADHQFEGEE